MSISIVLNAILDFIVACAKAVGRAVIKLLKAIRFKTRQWSKNGIRRDKLNELGRRVFELSQNGTAMPDELTDDISQIVALEQSVEMLRKDYADGIAAMNQKHAAQKAALAEKRANQKAAVAEKRAAAKAAKAALEEKRAAEAAVEAQEVAAEAVAPEELQVPTMETPLATDTESEADNEAPTLEV